MYKIKKEGWFYTNPRDFAAGKPSDKNETHNEVLILRNYKVIDKRHGDWNVSLVEKTFDVSKADVEKRLEALPMDIPFLVRQSKDWRFATTDETLFNKSKNCKYYSDYERLGLEGTKRLEVVLPDNILCEKGAHVSYDGIVNGNLSPDGKMILDTLEQMGFKIKLEVEEYQKPTEYYSESKRIQYQINPPTVTSIKDYFGKEIKPGDTVVWAEGKGNFYDGKVVEIFSDKVKIERKWYGNEISTFNIDTRIYSFIKK